MKYTKNTPTFAQNVLDENKMKKLLPKGVFDALTAARKQGKKLSQKNMETIARVALQWATQLGAKRFAHTFFPLNNCVAFKRDSLYSLTATGDVAAKFGAKQLFGETDASSFPSGGLRQTHEARGLMAWDINANFYIIEDCLHIPCTFYGANGEVLDTKTPLVRSNAALNKQTLRVLNLLGCYPKEVFATVGAEQEYFLIDRALYLKRPDLICCGRTIFGAAPPKWQTRDNYFCAPDSKTGQFMREMDDELFKLGIVVQTEHREVAPRQFELAPCYERADIAADHNMLTQQVLHRIAEKHGLACLLHEKPFENFNGSGKHVNWSLTADGENLLEMGDMGWKNARFLLFLAAIVKAVDDYSELLYAVTSSLGNDRRLGGMEAPPRVMTVYLGQATERAIAFATSGKWRCGTDVLPLLRNVERNRTSPFAFTGNKFEFRTVGSSASVAEVCTVLNVAVAESLRQFADRLEHAPNVWKSVGELICETFSRHKRVIFDGNNYGVEWAKEAKLRGLKECSSIRAIENLSNAHCVNLLERHGVLCHKEVVARQTIALTDYSESAATECRVAVSIFYKQIYGGVQDYLHLLANSQDTPATTIAKLSKRACRIATDIERALKHLDDKSEPSAKAHYSSVYLLPLLRSLRLAIDKLETLVPEKYWGLPTYYQMLFGTTN